MLHHRSLFVWAALAGFASAQNTTRVSLRDLTSRGAQVSTTGGAHQSFFTSVCTQSFIAGINDAVPGGGKLACDAIVNPVVRCGASGFAFFSRIQNSARNQAIFFADASGLHPIVVGCGGGGGSGLPGNGVGDPSPIGGTFSGLFESSYFAPAANANGDLAFIADVAGGTSSRGLFLYTAATHTIAKVAALGDASPVGGTIVSVGPGSINASGSVVFDAHLSGSPSEAILEWSSGVLTKVAALGDSAPTNGVYTSFSTDTLGYADGTTIFVGPAPDINDAGTIVFRADTSINSMQGIVIVKSGAPQWFAKKSDSTPRGGFYLDFQAPIVNNVGDVAFYCDWQTPLAMLDAGWFVGHPGAFRGAISLLDSVGGGLCVALDGSHNPIQPLDDAGNLLQWVLLDFGGATTTEALAVNAPDGSIHIVEIQGAAAPGGGTLGAFSLSPSLVGSYGSYGAQVSGGTHANGFYSFGLCPPPPVSYCTAKLTSNGCTPAVQANGTSSASSTSGFSISAASLLNQKNGLLIYGVTGRAALPFAGGTLCVKGPLKRTPLQSTGGNPPPLDCSGSLAIDMNAFAAGLVGGNPIAALRVAGTTVDTQFWSRDPGFAPPNNVSLSNAIEYVVGP